MSDDPIQIDGLTDLPKPFLRTDRLIVARADVAARLNMADWRGGQSDRALVAIPQSSDFSTWVNQNSAVVTDLSDGMRLYQSTNITGDSLNMRVRTLPGGSWDVQGGFIRGHNTKNYQISGLCLRESATGKIITWGFGHDNQNGIFANAWNNPTSYNTTLFGTGDKWEKGWFRIRKQSTKMQFLCSRDRSVWELPNISFGPSDSAFTITSYFTTAPDQWGAFININNNGTPNLPGGVDMIDWSE